MTKISNRKPGNARDRVILALDFETVDEARRIIDQVDGEIVFYKIGFQLVMAGGLDLIRELKAAGRNVFLDMKLLDIDATVGKAVANAATLGADMLTIHAYPHAMRAAVSAAGSSGLCLLGVTVLTSMNDSDLAEAGYSCGTADLVLKRAGAARDAGMGGLVASAQEAAAIRGIVGPDMAIVTPGIRPAGAEAGDQKRIMTPSRAILAGASHLVVGRPVTQSADPRATAMRIVDEVAQAC